MIHKKALYKTLSWRLISIIMSFFISMIFMGSMVEASKFALVYNVVSGFLYYWHEMAYKWLRAKGKI